MVPLTFNFSFTLSFALLSSNESFNCCANDVAINMQRKKLQVIIFFLIIKIGFGFNQCIIYFVSRRGSGGAEATEVSLHEII